MTDHRYEARAEIVPGEYELALDGRPIQLVRLTLTDAGPITRPDGADHHAPTSSARCAPAKPDRWPVDCSSSPTRHSAPRL